MVCVHYGPHGQRLIQRGSQLAGLLQAPLIVLTVGALGDNEYNREKQQYLSGWKSLTEAAGGQFVIRDGNGKSVSEVIADTARENRITQIIIGQSGQTFWEGLTRGILSMTCWSCWARLIFILWLCSVILNCLSKRMREGLRLILH